MPYMPKHLDISRTVGDTEDHLSERDFVASLKAEVFAATESEVRLAVGAAKIELLWTDEEKTLRAIFFDGGGAVGEGVQNKTYQLINYVLTHLVAAGMLDPIIALNFDKWSHSDAFSGCNSAPLSW